jgi:hypothetical protein
LSVNSTNAAATNLGGSISLGGEGGGATTPYVFGSIAGRYEGSSYSGYLQFSTTNSLGTVAERMRITSAGIVGINTASPAGDFSITMQNASGINAGFVALNGSGGTQVSATVYSDASYGYFGTRTAHSMQLITNGTSRVTIDTSGNVTTTAAISDSIGNVRTVPVNSQSTTYSLLATDAGKCVSISSGNITTSATLTAGQSVTIYNNQNASITITQGTNVVMTLVGTATTGNRTLAKYGLCTLLCTGTSGATVYLVITGGGLT